MAKKLVRDIMTKGVISVPEGTTIRDALKKMGEKNVSSLIVIRGEDRPYGVVTRKDIIEEIVVREGDINDPIDKITSSPLILATPNLRIKDAAQLIGRFGVRRLPVLQKGEIVGIISTSDIFEYLIRRVQR